MATRDNLFTDIDRSLPEELVEVLASSENVRVERIVSTGHATPDGSFYDQEEDEWVVVLKGEAKLTFDDGEEIVMESGDHVLIRAHRRHRVVWTSPDEPTIWLAVFFKSSWLD